MVSPSACQPSASRWICARSPSVAARISNPFIDRAPSMRRARDAGGGQRTPGEHPGAVAHDREVDTVRKHSNEGSSDIWRDDLILASVVLNGCEHAVDLFFEPKAQTTAFELVCDRCIADVRLGGLRQLDEHHPRVARRRAWRSARTSDQGRTSAEFDRASARRSAMTARCHSGTGTSAGREAIRSQSACTYAIFSSIASSSKPGGASIAAIDTVYRVRPAGACARWSAKPPRGGRTGEP